MPAGCSSERLEAEHLCETSRRISANLGESRRVSGSLGLREEEGALVELLGNDLARPLPVNRGLGLEPLEHLGRKDVFEQLLAAHDLLLDVVDVLARVVEELGVVAKAGPKPSMHYELLSLT